jgi:hypothetical protein
MLRIKRVSNILAITMVTLILLSCLPGNVSAQDALDPVVVVYDNSHGQKFDLEEEFRSLKLLFDMVNTSTRYIVKVNSDPITNETLSEADILIIADPDDGREFESNEVGAIKNMLNNGSSLLLLGGPNINQNSTYWADTTMQTMGENDALNILLDSLNITGPRFSVNETDEIWGDTMFDYFNALNTTYPWMIHMDSTAWDTTHPIFNNINELLVMTSTLKPINLTSSIANGYESTFAQYRRGFFSLGNYTFPNMSLAEFAANPLSYSAINGTYPSWMSAFQFNQSRIIISGSTIMFTGYAIDLPETEERWFYQADNARLFMNMLDWLSEEFVEAPGAIEPMLLISASFLVVGVAYYLLRKLR